ncbi:MAG: peptidase S10, partial [Candidatus Atribacteria bacterium]|nr:peptidase S10 [Candidatus Atribacteria bacterium]
FLLDALKRTDFLRVFVASGLYDLVTPYDMTVHVLKRFNLPKDRLRNITIFTYQGGHMMYLNPEAHRKLKEDLRLFFDSSKPKTQ